YEWIARLLDRPVESFLALTGGLNHFAWLLALRDRRTGQDLIPQVLRQLRRVRDRQAEVILRWYRAYGLIASGNIDHHGEYLPAQAGVHYHTQPPYHGTAAERAERRRLLRAIAAGRASWTPLIAHGSWEHPIDMAVALVRQQDVFFPMLNLPNGGWLARLPRQRIVEVPAHVISGRVQGVRLPPLPAKLAALCRQISDVHELAARAAAKGDREAARQAIIRDPAIMATEKRAALAAWDEILAAHADLLPQFRLEKSFHLPPEPHAKPRGDKGRRRAAGRVSTSR
ncbi:MAG: hypothetical protein N3A66_12310, partial [Planctomycetota bacterium]|nr:hypothetical protein [Planctomycetota bacterium]